MTVKTCGICGTAVFHWNAIIEINSNVSSFCSIMLGGFVKKAKERLYTDIAGSCSRADDVNVPSLDGKRVEENWAEAVLAAPRLRSDEYWR